MPGKRPEPRRHQRSRSLGELDRRVAEPRRETPPTDLRHVDGDSLLSMIPGDIVLLDGDDSLRYTAEPIFYAVVACPQCGSLGFITSLQYSGLMPVICGSNTCSCRFRIDSRSRLVYLPVN